MTHYIPIQGTWSWRDDPRSAGIRTLNRAASVPEWWQRGSLHASAMEQLDCFIFDPTDPFVWSTMLDGVWPFRSRRRVWRDAGYHLAQYVAHKNIPFEARNFIVYSHGLQPMLYALWYGLEARNIISISSPLREDVLSDVNAEPKPRWSTLGSYTSWTYVCDSRFDLTRESGSWFDGRFGPAEVRGDVTVLKIAGIGHGGLLHDRQWIVKLWPSLRWLLRADSRVDARLATNVVRTCVIE